MSRTRPEFVPVAIDRLRSVVERDGLIYEHTRAVHLPDLAVAYFGAGDVDSAIATCREAVAVISGLSSVQTRARLTTLDAAESFGHKPEVAELREQIRAALTAA